MLHIQCKGCNTSSYVDCVCPTIGHNPMVSMVHHPLCGYSDLGATVVCPEDSGCCDSSKHEGLSHDKAAHLGHPIHAAGGNADDDHEGPHTLENDACAVCRPVMIEVMPGSVVVQAVGGS